MNNTIIISGSIHAGKLHSSIKKFGVKNQEVLNKMHINYLFVLRITKKSKSSLRMLIPLN